MMGFSNRVRGFLATLAVAGIFACGPVQAQTPTTIGPLSPTSAWLVGPASLAATIGNIAARIPCVVANQYSNGFVVRFSGGDRKLMAVAIDLKQPSFTPRQRYGAEIDIPGVFFQTVTGAAHDASTIILNLQKTDGIYDALKDAEEMRVKIDQTTIRFAMIGLGDGLERMDVCYNPTVEGPARLGPVVAPNPGPRPPAAAESAPPQNPLIARQEALTPMPGENAGIAQQSPRPPAMSQQQVSGLMARAQEAERIAQDLIQRSPQKPAGAASPQQQSLPADPPPAQAAQSGQQMATGWTDTAQQRAPEATDIMSTGSVKASQAPETYVRREMRWRALKGANLREVLGVWAQGGGIELIWLSPQDFAVQRSLSQQATFETAVQALLEQFSALDPRPVGRIYREPGSAKLVLVVEMSRGP